VEPELAEFLGRHTPFDEAGAVWGNGTIPLCITRYLGSELPPLEYVTSVRCVVLRGDAVLVQRDRDSVHILPGGRREAGETPEETLRRELLEETGWTVLSPEVIGFMHFHHLRPKPAGYGYPHPDFLQVVYAALAGEFHPEAKLDDGYVLDSALQPVARVRALPLNARELVYLDAALARLGAAGG
jgi:ADP-ribose pyrophosphatase YjhB (NUDIX family)